MTRIAPIALTLFLAACGAKSQFIITAPEATTETRVRVASIEVITVSLPAYAAAAAIVVLLILLLTLNASAVVLRNRYSSKGI